MSHRRYYKLRVSKSAVKDDYKQGEIGAYQDFGYIDKGDFDNLDAVINHVKFQYGTPHIFADRIEYQCLENGDGQTATSHELELWKKGHIALYSCTYSFYLTAVLESEYSHADLCNAFPVLENEGDI